MEKILKDLYIQTQLFNTGITKKQPNAIELAKEWQRMENNKKKECFICGEKFKKVDLFDVEGGLICKGCKENLDAIDKIDGNITIG